MILHDSSGGRFPPFLQSFTTLHVNAVFKIAISSSDAFHLLREQYIQPYAPMVASLIDTATTNPIVQVAGWKHHRLFLGLVPRTSRTVTTATLNRKHQYTSPTLPSSLLEISRQDRGQK